MNHSAILQSIYQRVTHRPVRDLAWALLHPPLFAQLPDTSYGEDHFLSHHCLVPDWLDDDLEAWLIELDQSPDLLLEHLREQRATRLGIYFEQLLSFYFSHYPRFTLIAKNLQVNGLKKTIGEYDFIVKDHGNATDSQLSRYLHIEVAIKFYVGIPNEVLAIKNNHPTHNWHYWVGPNKKDTLAIKMNHLFQRQLRLSQISEGNYALESIGVDTRHVIPKLLLTGCVYAPIASQPSNHQKNQYLPTHFTPDYINSLNPIHFIDDNMPRWCYLKQLHTASSRLLDDNKRYIVLPRQQWMSPITHDDSIELQLALLSRQQLLDSLNETLAIDHIPRHIAEINAASGDTFIEGRRFFVLP